MKIKKGARETILNKNDNKDMLREQWRMLSKICDQQYQRRVGNNLGHTAVA
jgi:hypothetical protein